MKLTELKDAEYNVCGLEGFTMSEALRLWKTKFETVRHFRRDVITHESLQELGDFVSEIWETINPVTVEEALRKMNAERRRVMFDCIGVSQLFSALQPELLDKQTVSKVRGRWRKDNSPWEHRFTDTYELYRIDGNKLFSDPDTLLSMQGVFAVRCRCTTTDREYWIYVPYEAAMGRAAWSTQRENPDAIRAIAWTIRINITNPKRIFRQGDIIVAEESENSRETEPYHLTKEQYLDLLFSET